jgi:two-component system response regulator (stage 0 sporulation protein F)
MTVNSGDLLIVDDQMGVRRLISEALLERGYVVDQASSGREALEMLKEKKYHLIILDVKMPGMSGIETLHEIRKFDPGVSVVLMTAYEELDIVEEAGKLGVEHYLCKPFDLNELRSLARQLIPSGGNSGDCKISETG